MAYTPVHEFLLEKPKRPLSAYNYYFAFERQKLLAERKTGQEGSKGIGFANMGRTIANRWNNLKLHEKTQFQELAKKDKIRYKKEMDISVRYPSTPGGPREGNTLATVIEEQEIYSSCLKQAV